MKKIYLLLAICLMASAAMTAQTVDITFRITLKGTGKKLNANGIRITGALGSPTQTNWDPPSAKVLTIGTPVSDSIYSATVKVTRPADGKLEYKFINGETWGNGTTDPTEDERGIPSACAINGDGSNRLYTIAAGATSVVLPVYRFNTCTTVVAAGTNEIASAKNVSFSPNPMSDRAILTFENVTNEMHSVVIVNALGQVVKNYAASQNNQFAIEKGNLSAGMYFAQLRNAQGESMNTKFIVE